MLKKFIGPEAVELVVLGNNFGEVSPGDKIVVPDDELYKNVKWPENFWEDVADSEKEIKPKAIEARMDDTDG